MSIRTVPLEQLNYEQAFAELETVIDTLETEEIALEDAIQMFERGQALALRCSELLEKAELRVRQAGSGSEPADRSA